MVLMIAPVWKAMWTKTSVLWSCVVKERTCVPTWVLMMVPMSLV